MREIFKVDVKKDHYTDKESYNMVVCIIYDTKTVHLLSTTYQFFIWVEKNRKSWDNTPKKKFLIILLHLDLIGGFFLE